MNSAIEIFIVKIVSEPLKCSFPPINSIISELLIKSSPFLGYVQKEKESHNKNCRMNATKSIKKYLLVSIRISL